MARLEKLTTHILVCKHKSCLKAGARNVTRELRTAIKEQGLRREVMVTDVDCLDQCARGCIVCVYPQGIWYQKVDVAAAREIIEQHIKRGKVLNQHLLHDVQRVKDSKQAMSEDEN